MAKYQYKTCFNNLQLNVDDFISWVKRPFILKTFFFSSKLGHHDEKSTLISTYKLIEKVSKKRG